MMVNTNNLVSISEANQNFSKVARLVDERGSAVILKNNIPRYLIVEFSQAEQLQTAADEDVMDMVNSSTVLHLQFFHLCPVPPRRTSAMAMMIAEMIFLSMGSYLQK